MRNFDARRFLDSSSNARLLSTKIEAVCCCQYVRKSPFLKRAVRYFPRAPDGDHCQYATRQEARRNIGGLPAHTLPQFIGDGP